MTALRNNISTYIDPNKEVLNFGKYKGNTFEQIRKSGNASYIIWVSENLNKYKNKIPKDFILKCKDCIWAAQDARGYSDSDWAEDAFDMNDFGNN